MYAAVTGRSACWVMTNERPACSLCVKHYLRRLYYANNFKNDDISCDIYYRFLPFFVNFDVLLFVDSILTGNVILID